MLWLKELGAIRPMAPAGRNVLVLGKYNQDCYPIKWSEGRSSRKWVSDEWTTVKGEDSWYLFGYKLAEPLTEADCRRILSLLGD